MARVADPQFDSAEARGVVAALKYVEQLVERVQPVISEQSKSAGRLEERQL